MRMYEQGFSLFELLITLAIIGILATITYPIYMHALLKTHRTEAKIALINLAQQMEIYYLANNRSYLDANFSKLQLKDTTEKKFYRLIIKSTASSYQLSAEAKFSDPECYLFMLNHLGEMTNAGIRSKQCW